MALPDAISKATEPGGAGRTATCLFIGGSADGQRIPVPDGMTWFRMPIPSYGGIRYDEYRREWLASPSQRYIIFVENSLTLDTAMQALINNYGRLVATSPESE